ncbi:unnamed protein product [Leptosia nina]|uniref:Circumsporozoite protein n=1 Tax=Leptosia nina TaxID=320188 RepID=A0AAV1K4D3_9NEOP
MGFYFFIADDVGQSQAASSDADAGTDDIEYASRAVARAVARKNGARAHAGVEDATTGDVAQGREGLKFADAAIGGTV